MEIDDKAFRQIWDCHYYRVIEESIARDMIAAYEAAKASEQPDECTNTDVMAKAMFDCHRNDMGEDWYRKHETWESLTDLGKKSFYQMANAALASLPKWESVDEAAKLAEALSAMSCEAEGHAVACQSGELMNACVKANKVWAAYHDRRRGSDE